MVTPSTSHLDPPKNWDEFEDICADLFGREWDDRNTVRYGRLGQEQHGVDIYGRPDGTKYAGVQCKGKRKWPPPPLKTSDIDEEVTKAKEFDPPLTEFTIATIAADDGPLQDHVRKITGQHEKDGLFSVHVVGWGELSRRLTQHADLVEKHYNYVALDTLRTEFRNVVERLCDAPSLLEGSRTLPDIPASGHDAAVTQALERDLSGRYEAALQRSFFTETAPIDEFQNLADSALDKQYSGVSESLRRRVLLRASRSATVRKLPERGKVLLSEAQKLAGEDSDIPARARIAEASGDVQGAIALLRDLTDADGRSTLFNILYHARGADAALEWLAEEDPGTPDLSINGVHTLCISYLQKEDIESVRAALEKLAPDQIDQGPYFL